MRKTGMVSAVLLSLVIWSTPVMSAEDDLEEIVVTGGRVEEWISPFEIECARSETWVPTQAELEKILANHLVWMDELETDDWELEGDDERRAHLCNTDLEALSAANDALGHDYIDLSYADLNGADLYEGDLEGAYFDEAEMNAVMLSSANLSGASLNQARLNGANLSGAYLNCLDPGTDQETCVDLENAELNGAYLLGVEMDGANLQNARLNCLNLGTKDERCVELEEALLHDANLVEAQLNGANLTYADLSDVDLSGAQLNGAILNNAYLSGAVLIDASLNCLGPGTQEKRCVDLEDADLVQADLEEAQLNGANLSYAELDGADLTLTQMKEANFTGATLTYAEISETELAFANFRGVDLEGATYEPASLPDKSSLTSIFGVSDIKFDSEYSHGVIQLRNGLKDAGQRDDARELTFLIKQTERRNQLDRRGFGIVESAFSYILFEATTEWGRTPGRALLIICVIFLVLIPAYAAAIAVGSRRQLESGIYVIEPKGRMIFCEGKPMLLEEDRIERLGGGWGAAFWYGSYFSLLSSFHLGWRELNVGVWISRLQPVEMSFRARGWVRVLSGIQSLMSVYLLAIWALTYFGYPFD